MKKRSQDKITQKINFLSSPMGVAPMTFQNTSWTFCYHGAMEGLMVNKVTYVLPYCKTHIFQNDQINIDLMIKNVCAAKSSRKT